MLLRRFLAGSWTLEQASVVDGFDGVIEVLGSPLDRLELLTDFFDGALGPQ